MQIEMKKAIEPQVEEPVSQNDVDNLPVPATQDEQYNKFVAEIRAMNVRDLVEYLEPRHRSDVYLVLRDIVSNDQIKAIDRMGREDVEFKKRFQAIKQEAKASWDYDHRQALMSDVNKACTNVYTVALQIMGQYNSQNAYDVELIHKAIDEIRIHVGLKPFEWEENAEIQGKPQEELVKSVSEPQEQQAEEPQMDNQ